MTAVTKAVAGGRATSTEVERTETAIIGAGQAGLSVGYHLTRRGRPCVIVDANERVGDNWRRHWDSLRLYSPARADGLPGMAFPAPPFTFPGKDEVADYLEAYAAGFELPVRTGVHVRHVSQNGGGYVIDCGEHTIESSTPQSSSCTRAPTRTPPS